MRPFCRLCLLAVCLLLGLTACKGREEAPADSIVYAPQKVAISSPLSRTESACISGEMVYLLGSVRGDDPVEETLSLVRVPLEGGKAEPLPAFRPARLEGDAEYESTGGFLRPGRDGTLWLTEAIYCQRFDLPEDFDPEKDEKWRYLTDSGPALVLRQLDGEGNELAFFDGSTLCSELGAEQIYDLWTDGAGTFFANIGSAVALMDGTGAVRSVLEADNLTWKHFAALSDGRTAILDVSRGPEGYTSQLRTIDQAAGDWGEAFPVPSSATCFWSGDGEALFYYTNGDTLCAWRQGAEEPERVMSWTASGVDANGMAAVSLLPDERLAAVTYGWSGANRGARLTLLTPTDAASLPERTVLTLATVSLSSPLRGEIADFNSSSETCFISVKEYLPDLSLNTTGEEMEQAWLRMATDMVAGNMPDIIEVSWKLPIRRLESGGLLEDLWPYIEADPELGREALMERPLEAVAYNGGLYRVANAFMIETLTGARDVVGEGMSWTYDEFWAAFEDAPEGCLAAGIYHNKNAMLTALVEREAERFVDWEQGVSDFDSDEFRAILAFCSRFPDEPADMIDDVAIYTGEQMLYTGPVGGFDSIQYLEALFGGEVAFVGWPNNEGRVGSCFRLCGTELAMSAACTHKEEVWSFLRRQLLPSGEEATQETGQSPQLTFPIHRRDFDRLVQLVTTPIMVGGKEARRTGWGFTYGEIDMHADLDALTQEEYGQIMALYNAAEGTSDYDINLMNIITEQAGAYFAGDRSLDDTVSAIQSRVGLYLAEMQ